MATVSAEPTSPASPDAAPAAPPTSPPASPDRQERRKAATRRRIIAAADQLFQERDYVDTSIEDIADAADVAVRTIYLHFGSKAAIMLSYADTWIDAFVEEILARPVDEPVTETLRAAVAAMTAAGWADRAEGGDERPHPLVEYIGSGPLDLAGHVPHRWMAALRQLADDFASRASELPADAEPIDPYARAIAVYTVWISSMFAARERTHGRDVPTGPSGFTGLTVLDRLTSGTF